MPAPNRSHALDHIVVVLFENRSLDNVLGHLYRPEDPKNLDGVIGNPIPEWAEHGADRKVVPYTVATDLDSPNPDSSEEYHTTPSSTTPSTSKAGSRSAMPWQRPGIRRHWGR